MSVIALALGLLLQDDIVTLEKDPWEGFKLQSWVKRRIVRAATPADVKLTLSEIGEGHKRILIDPPRAVAEDEDDGTYVTFEPYSRGIGLKQIGKGSETLPGGIKARVIEYGPEETDMNSTNRWRVSYSDQVPGGIARVVRDYAVDSEREKIDCGLKSIEKLKIAGREIAAYRFDYVRTTRKDEKTEATWWLSGEVPGLLVRLKRRETRGKTVVEMSVEVGDFEAGK